ncbi:MAG: ABC transporter ATP-binding protein [Pseudomonadota bacterium]
MATLAVEGLSGTGFGPVGLEVGAGRCTGLAGHSGSGKSQILRAIADLEPSEGRVRLDGRDRTEWPAPQWRCRVALLPAEPQWWATRVDDHFAQGLPQEWLERVGLPTSTAEREVARLSTGERQRLALLRVMVMRPEVLLLDEPTSNLDSGSEQRVEDMVAEYRAASGAAVLWVSHDEAQLNRVAECSYRVHIGRLGERCGEPVAEEPSDRVERKAAGSGGGGA